MKLLARQAIALVAAAILLTLTGCSKSTENVDLLKNVPATTELVCKVDFDALLKSAGEKRENGKIVLPDFIAKNVPTEVIAGYEALVNSNSVNLANTVIAGKYQGRKNNAYGFVEVTDRDALIKFLDDNKYTACEEDEEQGLIVYADFNTDEPPFVIIAKDFALLCTAHGDDFDAMNFATDILSRAKDRSVADTEGAKYLGGHTVSALISTPESTWQQFTEMGVPDDCNPFYAAIALDIKDLEAKGEAKFLNSDYKTISFADLSPAEVKFHPTTVNKKALSYMSDNEVLVYALSCKDIPWDIVFEALSKQMRSAQDRTMLAMIQPYIANIDGTVAIGMGGNFLLSDKLNNAQMMNSASMTFVAQMKDKKAKEMVSQLKSLAAGFRMPVASTDDGFSLTIPGSMTVFIESHDDMLVIANHVPAKGDCYAASSIDWGKFYGGMCVAANGKTPLFENNGLGKYDTSMAIYVDSPDAIKLSIKCKGGDAKGLIEWYADFAAEMQQKFAKN